MSSTQTSDRTFICDTCKLYFKAKKYLDCHYKTKKHTNRLINLSTNYGTKRYCDIIPAPQTKKYKKSSCVNKHNIGKNNIITLDDLMLFEPDDNTCYICCEHFESKDDLIKHVSTIDHIDFH